MTYFKISLPTRNWDIAKLKADNRMSFQDAIA